MTCARVCLVVDNPLRDLDGLTLVAWQLAQQNCEVWLVPMYEQAFDVRAVDADFVLVNYARGNNRSHLCSYLGDGIRVGVLDTEGVGGKNAEDFAALVGSDIGASLVDLYCVWGPSQGKALLARQVVGNNALRVTGCPRYDFCALPWRNAVPKPAIRDGFVLVNTNFPVVNPRFSGGSRDEVRTMVGAGFEPTFAHAFIRDARAAQAGFIDLLGDLVDQFPSVHFVLRPHPFESAEPYQLLATRANLEVRQEGTSIEWLNACKVLLHLNCNTAVEAAMLGKTAISPAWLDTPTLNVEAPHQVSLHATSPEDLVALLAANIETTTVHKSIEPLYYRIDGQGSNRVAQAILETLNRPRNDVALPRLPLRFRFIMAARRLLGYRASKLIEELGAPERKRARRQAKLFARDQVNSILCRLRACAPSAEQVIAESMSEVRVAVPRWASGTSIRVTATPTYMTSNFSTITHPMHQLTHLTSSLIYFRCLAANIFHKLVVRRVRSRRQVTSDYDQGEWLETLREARWLNSKSLSEYVTTTDTRLIDAIVDGRLTRISRSSYYKYRTSMLVETLQRYAGDENELVEIGSGAGRNLIALAYAGPWESLIGLELSQTGREVTRRVCERFNIQSIQTAHIDLLDPKSESFDKLRGAVVFSFYCLEQLPSYTRCVMENLCLAGVKRVIHIEPTTELFGITSLKDLATISYIWRQDYQRTLLTTARTMQKEGKVKLLASERLHFAPSCRNDPTLVVWEPIPRSDEF